MKIKKIKNKKKIEIIYLYIIYKIKYFHMKIIILQKKLIKMNFHIKRLMIIVKININIMKKII